MGSSRDATTGPGEIIGGKYRVEGTIGEGGMGTVLAVTHLKLNKPRAIKLMRRELSASAEACRRFLKEAEAASGLHGEHVARVLDVDQLPSGEPYMVMERLVGADLATVLEAEAPLPIGEAVLYARQVCAALAEAHALGIVHRDVKPANLFLTRRADGVPSIKVLDFGIAKATAPGAEPGHSTGAGAFLGTLHYMSPEQMTSARDVDARTDLWALGVVLYEMLTGQRPFESASKLQLFALVTEGSAPPPSDLAPEVPAELDAVVMRCLARDRDQRPASATELAALLEPFAPLGGPVTDRLARMPTRAAQRAPVTATAPALREADSTEGPAPDPGLPREPSIEEGPVPARPPRASERRGRGAIAAVVVVVVATAVTLALLTSGAVQGRAAPAAIAPAPARDPADPALTAAPGVVSASAPAAASAAPVASASSLPPSSIPPAPVTTQVRRPVGSARPRVSKPIVYDANGDPVPD